MITAEKARSLMVVAPSETEVKSVEAAITKAVKNGDVFCWYYVRLSDAMKRTLLANGFKYNEQFDRNEYLVKISWAGPTAEDYYNK